MATQVLTVASTTSTITYAMTNAQVAQILEWFIADLLSFMPEGLTAAQQNQWKLDQANAKIRDYVRSEAKHNRARILRNDQINIDQLADADTAI